jgi:hypothetical protein
MIVCPGPLPRSMVVTREEIHRTSDAGVVRTSIKWSEENGPRICGHKTRGDNLSRHEYKGSCMGSLHHSRLPAGNTRFTLMYLAYAARDITGSSGAGTCTRPQVSNMSGQSTLVICAGTTAETTPSSP